MPTQLPTPTQLKNLAVDLEAKEFEQKQHFANILFEATNAVHNTFFLAWRELQMAKDAIDALTEGQQRKDLKKLADNIDKLIDLEGDDLVKLCDEASKIYKAAHGIK